MLTAADLNDEDAWTAMGLLEMCRDGCLYTTETGYAWIDAGSALPDPDCKQIADRLVDANMMTRGNPASIRLEDGTHTTAQLDITAAGRTLFDQLNGSF